MLFGDNLLDFTDPKKSTAKEREKLVQKHEKILAKVYYIPNPMYGSWESTLYHNNHQISKNEKIHYERHQLNNLILKRVK